MLHVMLFFVFVSFSALESEAALHPCTRPCQEGEAMTCHYNFTLQWYRTLGKACYSCPFNVSDCYREECIAADGNVRAVIAINRQVPGPAIQVCEGDRVQVAVTNLLADGTATSLHWHGQHLRQAPHFDGVGQVTQCLIQHQETFLYSFKAYPAGTHWYHSHTGLQLADGAFGAFIVRQPENRSAQTSLYDQDLTEHVLLVYDWLPVLSMPRYLDLMHVFDSSLPSSVLVNGRGRKYNVTDPYGVMETGNQTEAQTPLHVVNVLSGRRYRLRVISAAPMCPLQISVDDHVLTVISVDGQPLSPAIVDASIIHPGERYDFVLRADRPVSNYWIRVLGLGDCEYPRPVANGMAILRYDGAASVDPQGDPGTQRDGILLNPILFDGDVSAYGYNRTVVLTDDMRYAQLSNYTEEKVDIKFIIGMDYNNNDNTIFNNKRLYPVQSLPPRMGHSTPVMDNITFTLPPIPILTQPEDVDESWFCNRSSLLDPDYCLTQDLCICTHLLRVPLNAVVELIVFHEGRFFSERGHNMHLHGHSFRLLGLGKVHVHVGGRVVWLTRRRCDQPRYSTMGRLSRDGGSAREEGALPLGREACPDPVRHSDPSTIGCRSAGDVFFEAFAAVGRQVAPSLSRDRLEAMDRRGELRRNYVSPPVRDTVNIPDGGYGILRFVADNPGFWFFHCHTDSHLAQGMALLFQVGTYEDLPPLPLEFPRCGGMGFSNARRSAVSPASPTSPTPACSPNSSPSAAWHKTMLTVAVTSFAWFYILLISQVSSDGISFVRLTTLSHT